MCALRFAPCTPCTPCTVRFLLSALHSRLASPSLTSPHPASPCLASFSLGLRLVVRKKQYHVNQTPRLHHYHWNTIAKAQRSRRCESGAWSTRQAQSIEIMHLLSSQLSKGCCATPIVPCHLCAAALQTRCPTLAPSPASCMQSSHHEPCLVFVLLQLVCHRQL
jgi:hypothetical protein